MPFSDAGVAPPMVTVALPLLQVVVTDAARTVPKPQSNPVTTALDLPRLVVTVAAPTLTKSPRVLPEAECVAPVVVDTNGAWACGSAPEDWTPKAAAELLVAAEPVPAKARRLLAATTPAAAESPNRLLLRFIVGVPFVMDQEVMEIGVPRGILRNCSSAEAGTRTQPCETAPSRPDRVGQPCTATVPGPPP